MPSWETLVSKGKTVEQIPLTAEEPRYSWMREAKRFLHLLVAYEENRL